MQKKIAVLITFLLSILIQLNSSSVEWIGRAEVGLRFSNDYILLKVGEQRKLGHKYFVQNVSKQWNTFHTVFSFTYILKEIYI